MNIEEILKSYIHVKWTDEIIEKFKRYEKILVAENEKVNLTAIKDTFGIATRHFLDSITPIPLNVFKDGDYCIDVGAGAGFPSVPLAIMLPNTNWIMSDSLNKRIKFLDMLFEEINIKNAKTLWGRIEDVGRDAKCRERFDIAVARGVSHLSVLLEYTIPLLKVGGRFVAYKGDNIDAEIKEAENAFKELGCRVSSIEKAKLPMTDITHSLLLIDKFKQTNIKYPRKAGIPTRKQL